MIRRTRVLAQVLALGLGGSSLGFTAGLLVASAVFGDPFWRAYLTGPPVAGLYAMLGAAIAYVAATAGSVSARRSAERQEWWCRAEWALDLARSKDHTDRRIGSLALQGLREEATESEAAMIAAVTSSLAVEGARTIEKEDAGCST
jgi:hypothetical protein